MSKRLIPSRLIDARKAAGLSQIALCKTLNINQGSYSHYESGTRSPNPHTIDHLAMCLGTSRDYLTGESDDPSPDILSVSRSNEPELYDLVIAAREGDKKQMERFLQYYLKLKM